MRAEDLYYTSEKTIVFYSSIHAFRGDEIKVNNDWWEADKETIANILEGKLKYEGLKLVVSQERIDEMLETALKENNLKSTIEKALDTSLEEMKQDITRVTNSFKRVIPQAQEAIEEISKSVASTNTFKNSLDKASKAIEGIKVSLPSTNEIKDTLKHVELELTDAKKEFTQVTDKLKELFK